MNGRQMGNEVSGCTRSGGEKEERKTMVEMGGLWEEGSSRIRRRRENDGERRWMVEAAVKLDQ